MNWVEACYLSLQKFTLQHAVNISCICHCIDSPTEACDSSIRFRKYLHSNPCSFIRPLYASYAGSVFVDRFKKYVYVIWCTNALQYSPYGVILYAADAWFESDCGLSHAVLHCVIHVYVNVELSFVGSVKRQFSLRIISISSRVASVDDGKYKSEFMKELKKLTLVTLEPKRLISARSF